MNKREFNKMYAPQDLTPRYDYGVFIWDASGIYKSKDAIKIFKSEKRAQKHADKLNEVNPVHVIREVIL